MILLKNRELYPIFNTIIKDFNLKGQLVSISSLSSGNINDTYLASTLMDDAIRQYIVQRINHIVFPEPEKVADNVSKVTDHIEKKLRESNIPDIRRRVLRFYRKNDGGFYHFTEDGNYWRVLSCVYNAKSVDSADLPCLRETGLAFGEFQKHLLDFPADSLYETIPDFHNTKKRYADLKLAAEKDTFSRLESVKEEYEYLLSMEKEACLLCELSEKGEIPKRVVHNDTKCNNVMFDTDTGEHLAVIDLDTVMPGLVAYDFGDAVRFAANPAGEDCDDVSKVHLDLDYYSAFAEGFVQGNGAMLTAREMETLPDGVLSITLELAARFLTDYLNGDVYFKCKKPKHNLVRTRAQIALAKDIFGKMPELRRRLMSISAD